jgi:malate synthase
MGGMAAQIPIKNDPAANEAALEKVRADKRREAGDGHDGTWVAHPDLVPLARAIFNEAMPTPHQIHNKREDVRVSARDLLSVPEGKITEKGLRTNINVSILYLEAWLRGTGCVPLYHLMEDAATAEISRAQIWQWIRHGASLADGRRVTGDLYRALVREELEKIRTLVGPERFNGGKFSVARELFDAMAAGQEFPEFLTLEAYRRLED